MGARSTDLTADVSSDVNAAERSGPRIAATIEDLGTPGLVLVRLAVDLADVQVQGRAASLGSCVVQVAFDDETLVYLGAYGGGPGFPVPPEVGCPVRAGARATLMVHATVAPRAFPQSGVVDVAKLCFLQQPGRGWLHCELRRARASLRGAEGDAVCLELPVLRTTQILLSET